MSVLVSGSEVRILDVHLLILEAHKLFLKGYFSSFNYGFTCVQLELTI